MIEVVRIVSDEGGWALELDGDFVDEAKRYLADLGESTLRFRLPQDTALELVAAVRPIADWWLEGVSAAHAHALELERIGVELSTENLLEAADLARKRRRENP